MSHYNAKVVAANGEFKFIGGLHGSFKTVANALSRAIRKADSDPKWKVIEISDMRTDRIYEKIDGNWVEVKRY